jgi:hypothetical protein
LISSTGIPAPQAALESLSVDSWAETVVVSKSLHQFQE